MDLFLPVNYRRIVVYACVRKGQGARGKGRETYHGPIAEKYP